MTYDAGDGYTLLFGGQQVCYVSCSQWGYFQNQTWALSASGQWTLEHPYAYPASRIGAAMSFDPAVNATILFGGYPQFFFGGFADTWSYQAGNWTQLNLSISPPGRWGATLTYDPTVGGLLLFGGTDGQTAFQDTWEFVRGSWTELNVSRAPSGRAWPSSAYDNSSGQVLLYGGCTSITGAYYGCAGGNSNQTWGFNGTDWKLLATVSGPPAWAGVAMASGGPLGDIPMFGGSPAGTTWWYHAGNWSSLNQSPTPGVREFSAMVYDPTNGAFWSMGGSDGTNGDLWQLVPPFEVRTPVVDHRFRDVGENVRLNASVFGQGAGASYVWSGLPPPACRSNNASGLSCSVGNQGIYQIALRVTTAAGSSLTSAPVELVVGTSPTVSASLDSTGPQYVGQSAFFLAVGSGGSGLVNVSWRSMPPGCAAPTNPLTQTEELEFFCTPTASGSFHPWVEVIDAAGETATSAPFNATIFPIPEVSNVTASRTSADVGQSVEFSVSVAESFGTYYDRWLDVPAGCPTTTALELFSITCNVTAPGASLVRLQYYYGENGTVTSGELPFTVFSDPNVTSLSADPEGPVTAGALVKFGATINPGSGGDVLAWNGLPAACQPSGTTALNVTCRPSPGTYHVSLTVLDSNNVLADSGTVNLTVRSPPGPSGPTTAPPPGSPSFPWAWLAVGGVVSGAVVAAAVLGYRRRVHRAGRALSTSSDHGRRG